VIYAHEVKEKKARYVGPRPGYPEADPRGWDAFDSYLNSRKLDPLLARANGWYPAVYSQAPRIVIPCSNQAGVPYFQARDVTGRAKLRYASPPASRDDSIVIVWPISASRGTVILEGPMCALAAAALNYVGIAVMGNQPSRDVLSHIAVMVNAFQPVQVVPDADMANLGVAVISWLGQEGIACLLRIPPKKDLAEMEPKERKSFLSQRS
jgi:hypothetical protein